MARKSDCSLWVARVLAPLFATATLLGTVSPAAASEVQAFRLAEAADFLKGKLDGTSVGPLGKLRLASALEKVASVEEPFLLSAAQDGKGGWVVGTGNSGKVLHVSADGNSTELFATEEPEVFAVWVEEDVVYAGGSPGARIYRYEPGSGAEMVFDTQQQYAWAIGRERTQGRAKGRLLVATGIEGKLLAFNETTNESDVVYDSDDVHLRTLLVRDSDVLVGTVGEGLILKLDPSAAAGTWPARTLYDAAQPEITSLTRGPAGSVFAAAVASEASLAQLPATTASEDKDATSAPPAGTRPANFEGARSVVLQVGADGSVETRGSFDKETVYSVLWQAKSASEGSSVDAEGDLWIATGQKGKLYRSRGTEVVLERDLDQLQLIQLLEHSQGLSIATTNGAALYRTSQNRVEQGEYLSKVLDAKFPSRLGTLHYEANTPPGTEIEFAVRSGLSAFPDETWAPWVELTADDRSDGAGVPDLDLSDVPRGRYLQWRAVLKASRATDEAGSEDLELSVVELSYLQENRAPEISKLQVMAPGVVLVNGSFNPSNQVFEPNSANRDGIFNSLDKPAEEKGRAKELWKLGYRTVKWEASDPNKDKLEYTVSVRLESEEHWYTIAQDITKTSWGFDSTVLPDGLYRIKVSASDSAGNELGQERTDQRTSGIVVIDHSPPRVTVGTSPLGSSDSSGTASNRRNAPSPNAVTVTVQDGLSPLRKIEVSRNAGEWKELAATDGMVDARQETFLVELGSPTVGQGADSGSPLVLLRAQDAAFNATVVRISGP